MLYNQYLRDGRLSAEVQRKLVKNSAWRNILRLSPFLVQDVWKEVLRHHTGGENRFLTTNLTQSKVEAILRRAPQIEMDIRRWDVDLKCSAWIRERGITPSMTRNLLKAGFPTATGAALLCDGPSLEDKVALAPHAYRADRAKWLSTKEGCLVDDETAWGLLMGESNIEPSAKRSMLAQRLTAEEVVHSAAVLHQRPGLRMRAASSDEPRILLAVSAVRLEPQEQARLVASTESHWDAVETAELVDALSTYERSWNGTVNCHPLLVLAVTPWCTPETWAYLAQQDPDLGDSKAHIQGDALQWSHRGYRYQDIRTLGRLPHGELRDMDSDTAGEWIHKAASSWALSAPYILLEALSHTRLAPAVRRERRYGLRYHARLIPGIMAQARHPIVYDGDKDYYSTLEFVKPEQGERAGLDMKCSVARLYTDCGLHELEAAGLTPAQWEIALALLVENCEGTVGDLISAVRAL